MMGAELNAVIVTLIIVGVIVALIKLRNGGLKLPSLPKLSPGDKKDGVSIRIGGKILSPGNLTVLACFVFLEVSLYLYNKDLPIFKGFGWLHLLYYPVGILLLSTVDEQLPTGFRRFMAKSMIIVAFSLAGLAHLFGSSSQKDAERSVVREKAKPQVIERLVAVEEEYTTFDCNGKSETIPIPAGETVEVNPGEGCEIAFDVLGKDIVVWGSLLPKTRVSVEGGLHSKERGRYMRSATAADTEVALVRCPKGTTMKQWRCYRTVTKKILVAVH